MSIRKPAIPAAGDRGFDPAVKECLERVMGRRGGRVERMAGLNATAVTSAPTAAEYNTLRSDVDTLMARFNALLDQIEDANG